MYLYDIENFIIKLSCKKKIDRIIFFHRYLYNISL